VAALRPAVDLTSLPSIDSISAETCIGLFLEAGVPEDLMRAALRKAWTADPAIRDFIGIADNQWDFNAEDAMQGFGALVPADYTRQLLARALGTVEAGAAEPEASAEATLEPVATNTDLKPQVTTLANASEPVPGSAPTAEAVLRAPAQVRPRSHGGALPKY